MVVFQALTWEARDEDDEHLISIFGKTESGKSICVTTSFTPYFFIKLDSRVSAKELYKTIDEKCPECVISYSVMDSKDVPFYEDRFCKSPNASSCGLFSKASTAFIFFWTF